MTPQDTTPESCSASLYGGESGLLNLTRGYLTMSISDVSEGTIHRSRNYGRFKVINFTSWRHIEVEFIVTGYKKITQASHIRRGSVRDKLHKGYFGVGYIGVGNHTVNGPSASKKAYQVWRNMLSRCYKVNDVAYKNYGAKGVTVCEEWHNFQSFADWYCDNYPLDGDKYDIDKDIIDRSMMIYSPETCCFVTPSENTAERNRRVIKAKTHKLTDPLGNIVEITNLSKFCREHGLSDSAMSDVKSGRKISHKGWTIAI